jgi:hypothetical protein
MTTEESTEITTLVTEHPPSPVPHKRTTPWAAAIALVLVAGLILVFGYSSRPTQAVATFSMLVLLSSVWVLADAYAVGARKMLSHIGPAGWLILSLIFIWPIGFLIYIGYRETIRQQALAEKVTLHACPKCEADAPPMKRFEDAHFCEGCRQWWMT